MRVWHVNTAAQGGGVAELLNALARYQQEPVMQRFITDADEFVFAMTKRLHNQLHGVDTGGPPIPTPAEHDAYLGFSEAQTRRLLAVANPSDLVVLHDPQTLGMSPLLIRNGLRVAWRCHIGTTEQDPTTERIWNYLSQFWSDELLLVFSIAGLVPPQASGRPVLLIPPSIDPRSPKNRRMRDTSIRRQLSWLGFEGGLENSKQMPGQPVAEVISEALIAETDAVILQVSRWDRLKDMSGLLEAFATAGLSRIAHLVLCGPLPTGIADDPEATAVLADVRARRGRLPPAVRRRVHLVCPDLADKLGNARIVNSLQRRASVVVQKSLQEGFGLTVTEAMWKAKPIVASRVGGIPYQLTHNETGLLVDDPADAGAVAAHIVTLLREPRWAATLGAAARQRVREHLTVDREAADHARLYRILAGVEGSA